jgi:N-acyl-D-amino-acid deacylase
MTFDLIIENGLVVDGMGAPGRQADVGLAGKQIAANGDLEGVLATRRLDAAGYVVALGFIDIRSHSDLALLANGRAESMIRQGVTTQVTGYCGLTPAPVHDGVREDLRKTLISSEYDGPWNWDSFGQSLDRLRAVLKATHGAPFVGHEAIRVAGTGFAIGGDPARRPTSSPRASTGSSWTATLPWTAAPEGGYTHGTYSHQPG